MGGRSRRTNFDKVLRDKATSLFFTNFPDSWDSTALWKMFSMYGKVVDGYIAFKKTKKDTRFGFVRFINFRHLETFERRLKEILIRESRLVINRAKFFKGGNVVLPPSDFPPLNSHKSKAGKSHSSHSFKEVKARRMLDGESKELSGLSFLFEWNSKETTSKSLEANKIWLYQWFDDIKPREEAGDDTRRLTWLAFLLLKGMLVP
ncbi:nucleotide-binding alpha-beta plait domain-containing protein [Tanacetum coccineum]